MRMFIVKNVSVTDALMIPVPYSLEHLQPPTLYVTPASQVFLKKRSTLDGSAREVIFWKLQKDNWNDVWRKKLKGEISVNVWIAVMIISTPQHSDEKLARADMNCATEVRWVNY